MRFFHGTHDGNLAAILQDGFRQPISPFDRVWSQHDDPLAVALPGCYLTPSLELAFRSAETAVTNSDGGGSAGVVLRVEVDRSNLILDEDHVGLPLRMIEDGARASTIEIALIEALTGSFGGSGYFWRERLGVLPTRYAEAGLVYVAATDALRADDDESVAAWIDTGDTYRHALDRMLKIVTETVGLEAVIRHGWSVRVETGAVPVGWFRYGLRHQDGPLSTRYWIAISQDGEIDFDPGELKSILSNMAPGVPHEWVEPDVRVMVEPVPDVWRLSIAPMPAG